MYYPRLNQSKGTRHIIDTFAGYNHNMRISDSEFYETKNLTSEYYPMLANRKKRGTLTQSFTKLQAVIAKDALYWVDNGTLYANGLATELTGLQTTKEVQLVSMGAYICIFPDKKYINTMDLDDYGSMGAEWPGQAGTQGQYYTGDATYTMCHQDGTYYTDVTKSTTEPTNPNNGAIWIDMSDGNSVKEWSVYTESWTVLETCFTRVDFTTQGQIPSAFQEYDGVNIEGLYNDELNGSKILYAVGGEEGTQNDYIVLVGFADEQYTQHDPQIRITRDVPDMDYVCEAQNRLWGCFYGNIPGKGNINEIYCCALGDFKNWSQYLGVSTDSWRASRGSDGPWTGCINYLGVPTFFKENIIHPISVSSVGAHQIGDIPARGVQKGSHKSLAVVNETLYYKSRTGVVAYQGGMPADVSQALGDVKYYNAVAGVFGQRYYISMKDSENAWQFFCFDASRGLWMHEDNLHVSCFAQVDDELYAQSGNTLIAINGTDGTPESAVQWIAESGIIAYEQSVRSQGAVPVRYISRFNVRLNMERGSEMDMFIEYDSTGVWQFVGHLSLDTTGTIVVPVCPRRCDHLRLRFEGQGEVKIFSIARILTKGSDV